jgi:hypothetical protein
MMMTRNFVKTQVDLLSRTLKVEQVQMSMKRKRKREKLWLLNSNNILITIWSSKSLKGLKSRAHYHVWTSLMLIIIATLKEDRYQHCKRSYLRTSCRSDTFWRNIWSWESTNSKSSKTKMLALSVLPPNIFKWIKRYCKVRIYSIWKI